MAIREQDAADVVAPLIRWDCDDCGRAFWVPGAPTEEHDERPAVCPWCGEEDGV